MSILSNRKIGSSKVTKEGKAERGGKARRKERS
jgi:hypothetical protein